MVYIFRQQQNKKQKYTSKHNIFFLIFLKLILVNLVNIKNIRNLNNYVSEIHLIIQGNGTQNILNSNYEFDPSEVLVNGVKDDTCKKICNLTEDINNITLKFENPIKSCENMFRNLKNIIEIDLSNFDSSEVTSLFSMFRDCSSINLIDLSNLNTSKVNNMSNMFNNCTNLEKINFGNINSSSVENMGSIFTGCSIIKSIDLSSLDT